MGKVYYYILSWRKHDLNHLCKTIQLIVNSITSIKVSKSLNIITDFHLNEQSPLTSAQRKRIEEVYKNVKIQIRHLYIEILDTSFIERIACNCLYHENLLLSHLLLMKDSDSSPYDFNHVEDRYGNGFLGGMELLSQNLWTYLEWTQYNVMF